MHNRSFWLIPAIAGVTLINSVATGQSRTPQPSTKNGEWPQYTADLKGTKYSPLDQINASNFNKLEVAWRFKTDNLGPRPEYKLEGTPLMIRGVIYATAGTRRSVVALDAKTGEVLWTHSLREGNRAAIAPRQLSGRGLAFWTDGRGDDRVLYVTTGYRFVELNARTGAMISSFGKDGLVDLKEGVVYGTGQQIDLETGEIGIHSTPIVVKDVAIIGSSMKEGQTAVTHNNTKGLVRAFDVRTGKRLWTFNTIPRPGEFGNETWENNSWAVNGNTGVWTQITVDEDLGLVYLPVESPTSDWYGGERPGNNLFGESLVCVDLKTGQRKWHYQVVHHPIWNYDLSSAPILGDINVNGKAIKAVALPGKQAFLYVFDRVTGQPVWPIVERPVPQSNVPGEKTSPTQPFPTKPPAYARNAVKLPDDLIDFTPELRAQAIDTMSRYRSEGMFTPPVVGDPKGILGAINLGNGTGGTNWPGASYDPETHIFYGQAQAAALSAISLREPPAGFSDIRFVSGRRDQPFRVAEGPGFGTAADAPQPPRGATPAAGGGGGGGLNIQGLPILKPPYGVITAVNLDRGDIQWQVPYAETPDNVRNHPALKGMNIPNTGQLGSVGLLVTKTLIILGDSQLTSVTHPRGAMLRAYDKATGREVGDVWMPAPQSGSPMTYSVDGKQYIIVAISGGSYSGEYVAFSLPNAE
ncbi:MAG: PQQ-binding-like beta-propeller repeat protein [Bryobacteraceae bacterium]|jgi:quinoprotein glucose dehydrogenase